MSNAMPSAPDVLHGMRAPRTVRLEEAEKRGPADNTPVVPPTKPGVRVYVSKFRRYRVQVTAPLNQIDPTTGHIRSGGREIAAQFDEFVFKNDEHDPEIRAMIDRVLQSNKYFGEFGSIAHFWLANDQKSKVDARKLAAAIDTLKSLPKEALDAHLASLQHGESDDVEMPAPVAEPEKAAAPPRKSSK